LQSNEASQTSDEKVIADGVNAGEMREEMSMTSLVFGFVDSSSFDHLPGVAVLRIL
jgi:hypothetical protein